MNKWIKQAAAKSLSIELVGL